MFSGLSAKDGKSGGYFSPDRFTKRGSGEREHELALNPDFPA
jgi:hypothetical protein